MTTEQLNQKHVLEDKNEDLGNNKVINSDEIVVEDESNFEEDISNRELTEDDIFLDETTLPLDEDGILDVPFEEDDGVPLFPDEEANEELDNLLEDE